MTWLLGLIWMVVGSLITLVILMFFMRRWMISSAIDAEMCKGLISRLAKVDREKHIYKESLDESVGKNDRLLDEKLRNWDIPDKF